MIDNKHKEAAQQIMHEAEVTRQHTRYKIPAKIEIDGKLYKLADWSLSGCAIEDLPQEYCENKKCIKARIIFNFDVFTTTVEDIEIDFICNKRSNNVGGRFHNLNAAQLAVFNQVITAYINGDIITQEDIIHAVTKQITYPKKVEKKLNRKKADFLLILIYFTIFVLVSFLLFVAYQRVFVVQTLNAYVDANLTAVRSPHPSYITFPKELEQGMEVNKKDIIAVAHFVGGGTQSIHSPVDGIFYKKAVLSNDFRNTAEPICLVLPKESKSYIVAHLSHELLKKVSLGDVATVRLGDDRVIKAKVTQMIPAQTVTVEHSKIVANIYNQARVYDTLILEPMQELDISYINSSVFVTIDTLLQ